MVINFICRASKADKSGQFPLEVSIIINGVRRYVHMCLMSKVIKSRITQIVSYALVLV